MQIKTNNLTNYEELKLEVEFSGILNNNEKVSFYASYNKEGKMINCSSAKSACNEPEYYIEVAEYFKAMKNLEGQTIINAIEKIQKNREQFLPERMELSNQLQKLYPIEREKQNAIDETKKKIKRCKKQEKIDELTSSLNILVQELEEASDKVAELEEKKQTIYDKMHEISTFIL